MDKENKKFQKTKIPEFIEDPNLVQRFWHPKQNHDPKVKKKDAFI